MTEKTIWVGITKNKELVSYSYKEMYLNFESFRDIRY